ncbi:c-type cytochrome [Azospirillum agricola]|uniref:c-type cytochrome n=1 Tax=Azospirillum agricola TaxID=1720247 RepID=UPI000A0F0073|nr:cytochrome c family protein [Azospirillum agricola]MBP2231238.1 cytochrome c [Azospirillum agricola]SMH62708.1 cytochrome c [Azospirillum lipoferum]
MTSLRVLLLACVVSTAATGIARADGDAEAGQKVFNACKACHTIEAGGPNRVGPNLHGVVGRPVGSAAGFNYSPALKDGGFAWDEARLDGYLKDPKGSLPGNKMAFAGIKNDTQRADLVAFLKSQSQ